MELGAWGPGPNGPVVGPPLNMHPQAGKQLKIANVRHEDEKIIGR